MRKTQRFHTAFPVDNSTRGFSRIEFLTVLIFAKLSSDKDTHEEVRTCAKESFSMAHDFFDVMEENNLSEDED